MRTRVYRAFVVSLLLVGVLPSLNSNSSFASHTATAGHVGGFEIDGDFAFPFVPAITGATKDWATIAGTVSRGDDAFNSATDDVFGGGAKEETPDTWTFTDGPKPPGKDDLTRFYGATSVTATDAYLFIGFERLEVEGVGDAHANFEFNQKVTTVTNSKGAVIPERTAGDLLVVYDFDGGGKEATVEVRTWSGTALSGSWNLATLPAGSARADVNGVSVLRPSAAPFGGGTVDTLRFGEAALSLGAIFGSQFPGCPGFAQFSVKTRASGESFNSQLKDVGEPVPLTLARCPDVHITKSPPTQTVDAGDQISFSLVGTNDGIAQATGVVITDDLLDSLTGVSATFDVDPNTAGGTGTCSVGAGNVVTCAVGTLAASDGNTTGAEPDTVVVTITATTTPASCGVRTNRARIDAAVEAIADRNDNESNQVTFTVRCPELDIVKTADATVVDAGSQVGFTIEVTNTGAGAAKGVVISDSLPQRSGMAWTIESSSAGATCGIAGSTLTCTQASLAAGATLRVHVVSPTTADSCGTLPNTAGFTSTNDGSGSDSADITVRCPDVRVLKSTTTPEVSAGETVSYDITVSNIGAGTAKNVTVHDVLPAGFSWTINPAVPGCGIASGVLTCSFATLAPGASITIHVQSPTDFDDCGLHDNEATVGASNEPSSALVNNSAGPVAIVVNCADIDIDKTPDAPAVSAGQPIGFTLTITNHGSGSAFGVVVTDVLPAAAGLLWTVDAGSAAGSCVIAGGTLTCAIGTMSAGAVRTVHLISPTTPSSCGVVNNTGSVTTTNDGTDSSQASVRVDCPDLRIVKTADDSSVSAADTVGFSIAVHNDGPGSAFDVVMTDPLPGDFAWVISPAKAGCSIAGGTLTCTIGTMAAGTSFTVHVQAASDADDCGTYDNVASVHSSNAGDHHDRASLEVRCATVNILKVEDAAVVNAGDQIGFLLVISNTGDGDAYNVTVTDTLPSAAGLSWHIDGGSGAAACSIAGGVLSCSFGTMPFGAVRSVHISSATTAASCGTIDNSATVTASNDGTATDAATIQVRCADISIEKSADSGIVSAGDPVGFTVTVHNDGSGAAYDVTVSDPLPAAAGLTWTIDGGTAAGSCAIAGGTLACALGTMSAGATATVHVSSPTTFASCGTLQNTASVTTTNDGSDEASASIQVRCPSLRLVKTADDASVTAGDPIGFTITVFNDGPGSARDVVVSDPLPSGPGIAWSIDGGTAAGSCTITGGSLECDLGDMGPATSATVHVASATTGASCGTYDNTATASASNHADVTDSDATQVDCASIQIVKTADDAAVTAGEAIGFTITVRNDGAGEARGVTVTDTLPGNPGLSWTIDGGTAAASCSITSGTLTCSLGTMAPAAVATVHISSPTTGLTCGAIVNVAAVTTSNDGSAQANATIVVDCPVGINIVKEGPDLAHRGDTASYTMAVTTTTLTPLAQVAVTDPNCDAAPAFRLGDDGDGLLEVGETWIYTCDHIITATDPDPLPNTATATGVGNSVTVTDDDDHVVDLIAPDIDLNKTVSPVSGTFGTPVIYSYVVTNTGDTTLFDVLVTDDKLGTIGTVASLAAGAKATLTRSAVLGTTAITNIGTASGEDVLGLRVSDTDPATVTVVAGVRLVPTGTGPAGWLYGLMFLAGGAALVLLGRRKSGRSDA
ncbi:MAG TPA: hypothetical protein VGB64_00830 [Actinomycetota bacterium]